MTEGAAVIDASALVDFLIPTDKGEAVAELIRDRELHAPAHLDAEILSALGRLHRSGVLAAEDVTELLDVLEQTPLSRHPVPNLLRGAWSHRHDLRLTDALYVALARQREIPLITTDVRLAGAGSVNDLSIEVPK